MQKGILTASRVIKIITDKQPSPNCLRGQRQPTLKRKENQAKGDSLIPQGKQAINNGLKFMDIKRLEQ